MPDISRLNTIVSATERYLTESLLRFWLERSFDSGYGGFLTYFDRDGVATGETTKTFLMQIRMLYTLSAAARAGYGRDRCVDLARQASTFIATHYWDVDHEGWIWIADRSGVPIEQSKIGYGQCFALYAFSEYFLATGDPVGREAAERTYTAICRHMIDTRYGGYYELMDRTWQALPGGPTGGDRKSFDVHMHMMEALTTFYEMTGEPCHRRRLLEVIELIIQRMLEQRSGTGYMQFGLDFTPLPAIVFDVQWGRDAKPVDDEARPLDHTSPGHNMEFVHLLLRAADVLGIRRDRYAEVVRRICDHCVDYGIDHEFGGVYAEVPMDRPGELTEKQFWQQAEVLIGLLDAYAIFGDERYWEAFESVYAFVFEHFAAMEAGGEWYERVDRLGRPIDDALGHAWKISYHTVRSMIQATSRLKALADR